MPAVRLATFNVENLIARYKFGSGEDPEVLTDEGIMVNERAFQSLGDDGKALTRQAVRACRADVLALQEVENLDTLRKFRTDMKASSKYPYLALIDSMERRRMDVALMSALPIVHVRSYQHLRNEANTAYVFSRDCLEVDIDVGNSEPLSLFVNHFKSMIPTRGRTRAKRVEQVHTVREIVKARFRGQLAEGRFVVLGDFNDYPADDAEGQTAIRELVEWDAVENVVNRLPAGDRWTHYYDDRDKASQLDYVLVSKALARANPDAKPEVMRQGMPRRVAQYAGPLNPYTGPWFKPVGEDRPKASDHAPVIIELEV